MFLTGKRAIARILHAEHMNVEEVSARMSESKYSVPTS